MGVESAVVLVVEPARKRTQREWATWALVVPSRELRSPMPRFEEIMPRLSAWMVAPSPEGVWATWALDVLARDVRSAMPRFEETIPKTLAGMCRA